ncbi:MAG: PilZ domain-containing protein [Bacteroidetes bacterium]|nr:PilZ domain-containing protein [Bacteroidota bacterium]
MFKNIIPYISQALVFFKAPRKTTRYNVELDIICHDKENNHTYAGKVANISSGGFMALIPKLDYLLDKLIVKITFPSPSKNHSVELPVKHLWVSEHQKITYHGFRFLDFDGSQEKVVLNFLTKYRSES